MISSSPPYFVISAKNVFCRLKKGDQVAWIGGGTWWFGQCPKEKKENALMSSLTVVIIWASCKGVLDKKVSSITNCCKLLHNPARLDPGSLSCTLINMSLYSFYHFLHSWIKSSKTQNPHHTHEREFDWRSGWTFKYHENGYEDGKRWWERGTDAA